MKSVSLLFALFLAFAAVAHAEERIKTITFVDGQKPQEKLELNFNLDCLAQTTGEGWFCNYFSIIQHSGDEGRSEKIVSMTVADYRRYIENIYVDTSEIRKELICRQDKNENSLAQKGIRYGMAVANEVQIRIQASKEKKERLFLSEMLDVTEDFAHVDEPELRRFDRSQMLDRLQKAYDRGHKFPKPLGNGQTQQFDDMSQFKANVKKFFDKKFSDCFPGSKRMDVVYVPPTKQTDEAPLLKPTSSPPAGAGGDPSVIPSPIFGSDPSLKDANSPQ